MENATYQFSFYYKTDIDRSGEEFLFRFSEGTELAGNVNFHNASVQMKSEAKDGFVEVIVEFETGKEMDGFLPFIEVPFLKTSTDGFLHIDDVSLLKMVDTNEAWGPTPEHEAVGISTNNTVLSWQSGKDAIKHSVYFGESSSDLQLIASEISEKQFTLPDLENEKTYYWRVDEVDASSVVTEGAVWEFTTLTFYDEYMDRVKNERIESDDIVTWKQFGPGNSGFVNFLRYHPLLPDFCITSPDMGNTYQTEDNGLTWKTIKDIDGKGDFFRLYDAYYSTKSEEFAIAIESSRLYISNDTARSWTNIKNCPWYDNDSEGNDTRSWYRKVSAVGLDPTNDDVWYVGAGNFCRGQQQLWSSIKDANADNPRGVDSNNMGTIWKTSDAGKTWTTLTSGIDSKAQFSRIIIHPENSNIVFAASQLGLYKSTDAGSNWTNIGDGKLLNNTIMDMDYYYNATTQKFVLYVADQVRYYPDGNTTRNDGGIYKSTDNGDTWTNINGNLGLDMNKLTGGVPYNYYQYIAKWFNISVSEAQSQYPTKPTDALQYFNSLNVDPSREDALYIGFYDAQIQKSITPGRLWVTTNGGQSWINTARDYAPAWQADQSYWSSRNNPYNDNVEMGHAPFNQQWGSNYPLRSLRYCAVNTRGDVMILYAHNTLLSTDNGQTFTQVDEQYTDNGNIMGNGNSNLPGECFYNDKRLGEGIIYCGSGEHNLWRTTNDGTEGRQAATYLDQSQESVFAIVTHPWDEKTVYTTSMRQHHLDRIYKSTDAAETFVDWGQATLAEEWMKTHHLRIDPINPDNMYFGVTEVAGSGGGSGTDGPDKDKEGGFHKSTNGGISFSPSNSGMPAKVWVKDIEFDPRDDTRASLFVAAPFNQEVQSEGGLFHSTNYGQTWTEIHVSDKIEGVNNIEFDHTGRLYATAGRRAASTDKGGLFYSDDYGVSWMQIFEAEYVDNFDISPFDHNVLMFSISILSQNPGLYISTDRGQTWSKNNNTMGQPDKVTQIEFDYHDPKTIWVSVVGSGFYRGHFNDGDDHRKITVTPGTTKMLDNTTLQLSVETNGISGDLIYKSDNESIATVSSSGEITAIKQGAANIWVTSSDGRYSDFVYLVVEKNPATDIDDVTLNNSYKVYPNPAAVGSNLNIESSDEPINNIQIIDLSGKTQLRKSVNKQTQVEVNTGTLSSGLYVVLISTENHIICKKISIK